MQSWLNYHHLYYFKVIAECNSVSKAAEILRLGQPALSTQLKQFEQQLGIELFKRQNKKLILTEQGEITLKYAQSISKMGNELLETLNDKPQTKKLQLHLGAIDSIDKLTSLKICEFAEKHFQCQITISEGRLADLLSELQSHRIDLVISNHAPVALTHKNLKCKLVSRKKTYFIGHQKFKKIAQNFPLGLMNVPLILPTFDSQIRQDIELWAKEHNLQLNVHIETQDISLNQLLIERGHGVGVISLAEHEKKMLNKELKLLAQLKTFEEKIYLISAQRKIENPIARQIMSEF